VPVPPCRPFAESDDDVLPVYELSHLGEPKPRWRDPVSVQVFLTFLQNHFFVPLLNISFLKDLTNQSSRHFRIGSPEFIKKFFLQERQDEGRKKGFISF
jgi:hypothetical protein